MDRELKQVITLQAAEAVEEILETMGKGSKRVAWVLILEKRMAVVAEAAKQKPPRVH